MIAKDWRIQFREICTSAFEQDYFVVDYHSIIDNSHRRNFYEFSKEVPK